MEQVSTFRAKGIQGQARLDYASKEDVGEDNLERSREAEGILGEKDRQFRIFVVDDEQVIGFKLRRLSTSALRRNKSTRSRERGDRQHSFSGHD